MSPPLARPDNRLYLGRGGSGKSTLARLHAERFSRVLLILPDDSEPPPAGYERVDARALVEAVRRRRFRVAYVADADIGAWEWANEAAWHSGGCLVIWEEAGVFMRGRSLRATAPWAWNLWMRGRHRATSIFACSQRPAALSADVRANLSRAVIFHSSEPNDLRFYRSMIDGEAIQAIQGLDYARHEAVDWSPAGWTAKEAPFP